VEAPLIAPQSCSGNQIPCSSSALRPDSSSAHESCPIGRTFRALLMAAQVIALVAFDAGGKCRRQAGVC